MKYIQHLLILMIGLTIGFGFGNRLASTHGTFSLEPNKNKAKLNKLIDFIENDYLNQVNTDSLVNETVTNILGNLDPHSTYIPIENAQAVKERMEGAFIGIGIRYYIYKDTLTVISTIPNGPSDKAGILAGDRILTANLDTLYGKRNINNDIIQSKLKGTVGSKVNLKIFRPEEGELNYEIAREKVPLKTVTANFLLNDSTGYIKLERFADTSYKEFLNALENLKSEKIKTLVLDLRENGGGYVAPCLQIADELLSDGTPIMRTKNKNKLIKESIATDSGIFENETIYILIDENSASASEILAGAVQDNDRGTIVGRRSFGKGLVQQEKNLGDGSKIRLTVAEYFTPTGRSIQRPYNLGTEAYYEEYLERYQNGELQDSTKLKINDSLAFKTPKGKIVYGGGGIIPDIYIPKKSNRTTRLMEYSIYSGGLSKFVFNELDADRSYYNKLSQEEIENLTVNDRILVDFKNFTKENGIPFHKDYDYQTIRHHIKAEMANQLYYPNLGHKILSDKDPFILKVLELESE